MPDDAVVDMGLFKITFDMCNALTRIKNRECLPLDIGWGCTSMHGGGGRIVAIMASHCGWVTVVAGNDKEEYLKALLSATHRCIS
jgi:hypothetical protein